MNREFFPPGRAAVLIDGQFGSTGKGLLAAYLAQYASSPPHIVTTNASANAGHTTVLADGERLVLHHLPTAGVLVPTAEIYLNAGAVIDPVTLGLEVSVWDKLFHTAERLAIHPRAAIIEASDVVESSMWLSGGTGHGVSGAIARKAKRTNPLISSLTQFRPFLRVMDLNQACREGARVFVETPQGIGLGVNSGHSYPHCTSREVSVAQSLADAGIHPHHLGPVFLSLRTYPIRVGAAKLDDGLYAHSGGWYPDQHEVSWAELGVEPEITTVTKRPRRVASFSYIQAEQSIKATRPHAIFLNFVQYNPDVALSISNWIRAKTEMLGLGPVPVWAGIGPRHDTDVFEDVESAMVELKRRA